MNFLVDANLSPRLTRLLTQAGHIAVHVSEVGLGDAEDSTILEYSESEGFVLITADTDFPMMVALRRASSPSVVLLRSVNELTAEQHADLLTSNVPAVQDVLQVGAIVTLSPHRMRVRTLR